MMGCYGNHAFSHSQKKFIFDVFAHLEGASGHQGENDGQMTIIYHGLPW